MNKPNTICRVCSKEYFCCEDSRKIYSWRTMACSPDCFKEYMKRIEDARTLPSVEETKPTKMKRKLQMKQMKLLTKISVLNLNII